MYNNNSGAWAHSDIALGKSAYAVGSNASPEERVLFAAINKCYEKAYKEAGDHLGPQQAKVVHNNEVIIKKEISDAALYTLLCGVRLAARLHYADELSVAAQDALAEKAITREDVEALKRVFSVRKFDIRKLSINQQDGNLATTDEDFKADPRIINSLLSVIKVQEKIKDPSLSEAARKVAQDTLSVVIHDMEAFDKAIEVIGSPKARAVWHANARMKASEEEGLLEHWAYKFFSSGKYYHSDVAFSDEKDKQIFTKILAKGLSRLVINNPVPQLGESDINNAVSRLAESIEQHDIKITRQNSREKIARQKNLGQLVERREKVISRQQGHDAENAELQRAQFERYQQELIAQAERKRLEYEAFMASPQPYQLEPDAARIMQIVDKLAKGGGYKAHNAQGLLNAVKSTLSLLDMRDEGLKEIGGQLLSVASLNTAAKAAGLADSINIVPSGSDSLNERSKRIRRQYHTSDTVKQAVDTMLADNDMALLVAVHTSSPDHYSRYAAAMGDTARTLHKLTNEAQYTKTRLGNYSEAEFRELLADPDLRNEPDIAKLFTNQQAQDAAKAELGSKREALVAEVRQTFDGVPPRRVGSGTGGVMVEKTAVEGRVPNNWFIHLGDDFHLQESPKGEKYVSVHSNKYPELNTALKTNTPEPELISALRHLRNECGAHEANRKIRKDLHKNGGFTVTEENGVTVMKHKEYGIKVALEGSELDKTRALSKAMYAYGLKQFEQDSMLRTLELAGIEVKQTATATGSITALKLPDASHITLAPRGYFSPDDFAIALGVLKQTGAMHDNGNDNGIVEPARADNPSATESWQPGKGDNIIVFDANVLRRLSVSRGGTHGKTWLDITKETAKLPGVTVVVPEVVVFELTGKIPTKSQNGHQRHYKLVDQSYTNEDLKKSASAKHIDPFLENASYGQIESDGRVTIKGGRNNVVVMSTSEDVELYRKIQQQVLSAPEAERGRKMSELIYHNDEGEQAIARIIRALPGANYAVITDDTTYVNNSSYAVRKTAQGIPVVYAGTGAYLDAEINASRERYRTLARGLHCTQALSLYQITEDIVRGGQGLTHFTDPIMRYATHGRDPESGEDISIATIIAKAAAKSVSGHAGGSGHNTNGTVAARGGWAHEGLKKSRMPAEIARRAGADESWKR